MPAVFIVVACITTPLPLHVPVELKLISESVPVKFPFIRRPPVFRVKAPLITEPEALIVVSPVTVAAIGITRVEEAPRVKVAQLNTPFVPA